MGAIYIKALILLAIYIKTLCDITHSEFYIAQCIIPLYNPPQSFNEFATIARFNESFWRELGKENFR